MASLAAGLSPKFLEQTRRGAIDPAPFVRRINDSEDSLELLVDGIHCGSCVQRIEAALNKVTGVVYARVNLSTKKVVVRWHKGSLAPGKITDAIGALGFEATPFDPSTQAERANEESRGLVRCLGVAAFASMNVMLLSVSIWSGVEMGDATRSMFYWISALIAVPATLYAGVPFYRSAITSLAGGRANMDVPISVAVLSSLGLSVYETVLGGQYAYFEAPVMLLFLLLTGRFLDHRLRDKAREAAKDLLAMQSGVALRIGPAGHASPVKVRDIVIDDVLRVAPGETFPVNAVVLEGEGEVDRSLVTGESLPVQMCSGELVYAGTRNLGVPFLVRATARVDNSLVAELTRLIEAGEQRKARYVRWADQAARVYVPVVHTLAFATLMGWMLIGDASLRWSVMTAVAVLIITCPCALGLAVPAVQVVATGRLFRAGVLVKSGDALERLAQIDTVIFDKTGTLTHGVPTLSNPASLDAESLAAAAMLARGSRHPLSRAIASLAGPGPVAPDLIETPGEGLTGTVGGELARLGRRAFAEVIASDDVKAPHLWFAWGDRPPIRLFFTDKIRPDAASTVQNLVDRGLKIEMLSGDFMSPVNEIALEAGISNWFAQVSPQAKTARLQALRGEGRRVLMVGDGLNDAAALAEAHASVSFGTAAGASQAAADLIVQGDRLLAIVEAVDVARAAQRRVTENFAFSALYNLVAIPFAIAGMVTPLIAAIAMSASSLAVTLNALRLAAARKRS